MAVFKDDDPYYDSENFTGFSFDYDDRVKMSYSDYLPLMSKQAVGMTMRDSSARLNMLLKDDVKFPEFYHDSANFIGMQLTQG